MSNGELPFEIKKQIILRHSFFKNFTSSEILEIINKLETSYFFSGDVVLNKNDFIDAFYFLANGTVKEKLIDIDENKNNSISDLDTIGLNEKQFFSMQSIYVEDIMSLTELTVLRLDIHDFYLIYKKIANPDKDILTRLEWLNRLAFLKKSKPFKQLNIAKLIELTLQVDTLELPANEIVLQEGDKANNCYLVLSGKLEAFSATKTNPTTKIELLPGTLFGEAGLLSTGYRNLSVKTLEPVTLFVIPHKIIISLIQKDEDFMQAVIGFMVNRFRPQRNDNVKITIRESHDNKKIVTLEQTKLGHYYQLNKESLFIWEQSNGFNTIQDVTLAFFKQFKIFSPAAICNLLYEMNKLCFILIPPINLELLSDELKKTPWDKVKKFFRNILETEYATTNADTYISHFYKKGLWVAFTKLFKLFFFVIVIWGGVLFVLSSTNIEEHGLNIDYRFLTFLLILIPINFITVFLHEAAHAFSTKNYGYKVQRCGFGWYWFSPIVYADTSEMWLARPAQKLSVDFVGIYMDCFTGAILAILAYFSSNQYFVFIWLLSLFTYYHAFKNLSPIGEYDGYYLLMDVLDRPKLREDSLFFLGQYLTNKITLSECIFTYKKEMIYWAANIIYLICAFGFTFFLFDSFFKAFAVNAIFGVDTYYISMFAAVAFLFLTVIGISLRIRLSLLQLKNETI